MISFDHQYVRKIGLWFIALVAIIFIIKSVHFVKRWALLAPTTTETHQIAAGGNNQIILKAKVESWNGRAGSKERVYAAYCLDFTSSGEELEIVVVPWEVGYSAAKHAEFKKMTEAFAAGQTPKVVAGKGSGARGRIYINDVLNRGYLAKYAVLVRSKTPSEATFVVYHWH